MINVYFIPGICVNCHIFDLIQLPEGYQKNYIEWYVPSGNESLEEYARNMAKSIDTSKPFILIGYSLGAVIMQEMNKFLCPEQNIVLSSMKATEEIPLLFRWVKKSHIVSIIPQVFFTLNKTSTNFLTRIVFDMTPQDVDDYVSCTKAVYMKWAISQITNWQPTTQCKNLYHIHGTRDQIFFSKRIKNAEIIEGADHLMIVRKADEVNRILSKRLILRDMDTI